MVAGQGALYLVCARGGRRSQDQDTSDTWQSAIWLLWCRRRPAAAHLGQCSTVSVVLTVDSGIMPSNIALAWPYQSGFQESHFTAWFILIHLPSRIYTTKKNSCKQLTTQYTITDIVLMYFPALSIAARPTHLVISARLHLGSGVTTLDPA